MTILVYAISGILLLTALFMAIFPFVPAWVFSICVIFFYGLMRGFSHIQLSLWIMMSTTILLLIGIDFIGTQLGMVRSGASKSAVIGATAGAVIGPFLLTPLIGIYLGPCIGAIIGELIHVQRISRIQEAVRIGAVALAAQLGSLILRTLVITLQAVLFFCWIR